MTSSNKRLPLLDNALGAIYFAQIAVSDKFEQDLRSGEVEAGYTRTCKKECSYCCYYPHMVSLFEGALLYRELAQQGRWTSSMRQRCEEHAKLTVGLNPGVWLLVKTPCPLLKDNTCLAYNARPTICRLHWVWSEPSLCDPHTRGRPDVVPRTDYTEEFDAFERQKQKDLRLGSYKVPISFAILMGEKLLTGELDLDTLDDYALKEHTKRS